MQNHLNVTTASLLAALLSCSSALEEAPAAESMQDGSLPDPPGVGVLAPAPAQISEYPSAPHEDRHGNLWIATAFEGLVRYDGTELVTFTMADGLGGNSVREVEEDEDGTLWFATTGGLTRFDGESFTTLTDYEDLVITSTFGSQHDHLDIWDVLRDKSGNLWIATMDGVFRHDGKSFSRFELPAPGPEHSYDFTPRMVYCIFEDSDGALWFGTDGAGVVRYDGSSTSVFTAKDHGLCSDRVCVITQDGRGDYWFGTSDGGASRYDGRSFTTFLRNETYSESMGWGRVMSILVDERGDVWFAAAGPVRGAYRYDGEEFELLSKDNGLGDGHIASIREDRSGNIWFGTTAGVFRFDGQGFANFTRSGWSDD